MTKRVTSNGTAESAKRALLVPPLTDSQKTVQAIGAASYTSMPFFYLFPLLLPAVIGGPAFEGRSLTALLGVVCAVAPMSLFYLYALFTQNESMTRLTVFWRLFYVTPLMAYGIATGLVETHFGAFALSVDAGIPILFVALGPGAFFGGLSLGTPPSDGCGHLAQTEALVGISLSTAVALFFPGSIENAYIAVWIPALYHMLLLLSTRGGAVDAVGWVARAAVLLLLSVLHTLGWAPGTLAALAAVPLLGGFAQAYSRGYAATADRGRWVLTCAIIVALLGLTWPAAAILVGTPLTSPLAFNAVRQDVIIALFMALVAPLIAALPATHAAIASWLLPFSAIWFTVNTKLLVVLGAGTPFHSSWAARGLAPRWAGSSAVDLVFSLATAFLTVSTGYTATVLLANVGGVAAWHGIALILTSSLWMIARSSGIPNLAETLTFPPAIPPILPIDEVNAVNVHVIDQLMGISLLAADAACRRLNIKAPTILRTAAATCWVVSLWRKATAKLRSN